MIGDFAFTRHAEMILAGAWIPGGGSRSANVDHLPRYHFSKRVTQLSFSSPPPASQVLEVTLPLTPSPNFVWQEVGTDARATTAVSAAATPFTEKR